MENFTQVDKLKQVAEMLIFFKASTEGIDEVISDHLGEEYHTPQDDLQTNHEIHSTDDYVYGSRRFEVALTALRNGYRLKRESWKASGIEYIQLASHIDIMSFGKDDEQKYYPITAAAIQYEKDSFSCFTDCIIAFISAHKFTPYQITNDDLLAEDWTVTE